MSALGQEWNQRADLAGGARWGAVGFGIDSTGYIGLGTPGAGNLDDMWAWDQATDSWSQRNAFPGGARREALAFVIDGVGYVGFGRTGVGQSPFNDLWAYDAANDAWEQRASLPAAGRSCPTAFVLNGKGYVFGGNPNDVPYLNDLWEYDPAGDQWTQRASLPAAGRSGAVAFATGGKGYVGSGNDVSANYACSDMWEWDPVADSWTQQADLPGGERRTACYFPFDDLPIAGAGWDGSTYFTDFHLYIAANDSWSPIPEFEGLGAHTPVSFTLNGKGYVGTGGTTSGQTAQYWEFDKGELTTGAIEADPSIDAITAVVREDALVLSGWSSAVADRYAIFDMQGRTMAQGALRTAVIELPVMTSGAYVLALTVDQAGHRCIPFTHAGR